jgi:hypothetical protein
VDKVICISSARGQIRGTGDNSGINDFNLSRNNGLEQALYASNEQKIGSHLTLEYGIRYSLFQNLEKAQYMASMRIMK